MIELVTFASTVSKKKQDHGIAPFFLILTVALNFFFKVIIVGLYYSRVFNMLEWSLLSKK